MNTNLTPEEKLAIKIGVALGNFAVSYLTIFVFFTAILSVFYFSYPILLIVLEAILIEYIRIGVFHLVVILATIGGIIYAAIKK